MTGKRNVKTNLKEYNENRGTMVTPRVSADMFNKEIVIFATTVEGPTTQEVKEFLKNTDTPDDRMFAFSTNLTEVFIMLGSLKNNKVFGIVGVSAEVPKTLFPLIAFLN